MSFPLSRTSNGSAPSVARVAHRSRAVIETAIRRWFLTRAVAIRRTVSKPSASDAVVFGLTLALSISIGSTLLGPRVAAIGTIAGVCGAIATVSLASRRPVVRGIGGILAAPVAILVAVPSLLAMAFGVGIGGAGRLVGISLWGTFYAGFAATLISWDRMGDGGVRRGATGTILATAGVLAVVLVRVVPDGQVRSRAGTVLGDTASRTNELLLAGEGAWAVVVFFGLLVGGAVLTSRTLAYVPIERLLPPDRRGSFTTYVDRVRYGCSIAVRVAMAGILLAVLAPLVLDEAAAVPASPTWIRDELPAPIGEIIAGIVTLPALRFVVVTLAIGAMVLTLLEWIRRALRRGLVSVLARVFAPAAGGALVALVLAHALADRAVEAGVGELLEPVLPTVLVELIDTFPAFALAAVVLIIALGMLASTMLTVTWLRYVRVLPPRTTASALAASSIFLLAIVLAIVGRVETAIWAAVAAFVVWDLGEYTRTLATELGAGAATLRAELVHAGGSILIGGVVGGSTVVLYRWIGFETPIVDPRLAAVAVTVGILTVVLVSWALRG